MKRILVLFLAIILIAGLAEARVPRTMNVQGVLMDDSGNVMPDGDYTVFFQLWDLETDGSDLWGESNVVTQSGGYFNVVLGHTEDFPPDLFTSTLWLSMQVEGDSQMEPRIEMTSVASALSAGRLERGAAVLSLNGLKNNVNLQAGTNVTITQQDSTLVIAAAGGTSGADTDWNIVGNDISHIPGTVYIGQDVETRGEEGPARREGDTGSRLPASSKLKVFGSGEGIYSYMLSPDDAADGRHSIFGMRNRSVRNDGTGSGIDYSNSAVCGYNYWGDSFTYGVLGVSWLDFTSTASVMGSSNNGNTWGALAYRDVTSNLWGMFTPNNAYVGSTLYTGQFNMSTGATAGYIMTSDASGNASWSPPAAAQNDGDWTITGPGLYHSGYGPVALGTSTPHNWSDDVNATTMQIRAPSAPTLALDAQYAAYTTLYRWTLTGGSDGIKFNRSNEIASQGTTALHLDEGMLQLNRINGDRAIVMEGDGVDAVGPSMHFYSTSTATTAPLITLDPQNGTSNLGGSIFLRDGSGNTAVTLTANYNNSGTGRVVTPVLEITGGSDLSEQFDLGNVSELTKPGMVVSIDPENPGRLALSETSYDRRVAGVISGAGGVNTGMVMGQRGTVADGELPVALVGRVYVWADASQGPIEPGDLLTTSDRPGHAMKVTDHAKATGAILGKAMTGLSEGQGLILTLVTLQ